MRVCDTCGVVAAVVHEWTTPNPEDKAVVFEDPVWQVCPVCNDLIIEDKREVMLRRAYIVLGDSAEVRMATPLEQPLMRQENRDAIKAIHQAFWKYLERPEASDSE